MIVAVARMTSSGAPPAKSCVLAICAEPAKMTQLIARAWPAVSPALLAAAPQTRPKGRMLMLIGTKARRPSINSARSPGTCGTGRFCE
ncbi:MAG: hypothetical protein AW08_02635 [Candidatus Accumulibacter adjunctus]|uniref:Uncharacterized protein n=1 Tax=Candidatus Accumulibacter adjunctus TaxID=1454001 RepID=A0A011MVC7_9PROT|nr:MAG: hypothetical protein AW08_02635 [Candidatus Accumulibacter adjunctus]